MKRLMSALRRLDDHWLGDLIGTVCLFGMLYAMMLVGWALS